MSIGSRFVIVIAVLQLAILGWVLEQVLGIIPSAYPIELKFLVAASFILTGMALSFGKRGALPSLALICCWWLAYVLLFVGNDFGTTHPAGDGAKATMILAFGWFPPTVIVLFKQLARYCLNRRSPRVCSSYVIDEKGDFWMSIPPQDFFQKIRREKLQMDSVSIRMPTSLVCEDTAASREGLSRMKSVLERFRVPTFEIREGRSVNQS